MNNVERYPEAFENGIPKVGGRWSLPSLSRPLVVKGSTGADVHYVDGRSDDLRLFLTSDRLIFLGFSDPPVNQGAAAPQAAPEMPRGWLSRDALAKVQAGGGMPDAFAPVSAWGCTSGLGHGSTHVVVAGCPRCARAGCALHLDQTCRCPQAAPAPVPAPPPSRQAAVQEEGLAILPQTTRRHEEWERVARLGEQEGKLAHAKEYMGHARRMLPLDLAYDAEVSAIREGRVVLKSALKEMGLGDRRCFDLRGLREFEVMKSGAHALHLWWAR